VAIPLSKIKEGCCDHNLTTLNIIDGDSLDDIGSTCDKIIECSEKYILVEEKSILFAFFNNCCNELHINLDDTYKYIDNGVEYLKISDLIDKVIHPMNEDTKTSDMSVFYLYCNSGKPIDRIMTTWLSRYKKNIFIECLTLQRQLQNSPC